MNRWFFGAALELVVILGRHGVRSPLQTPAQLAPYAAEAWPQWNVPPGYLTGHGARAERALGAYFRDRYVAGGLLTGEPARDAPAITLRTDNDERTVESARLLGESLAPGQTVRDLHPESGAVDTLFGPTFADLGHPDKQLLISAVLGRMGNNPSAVIRAHQAAFDRLEEILFPERPVPAGKKDLMRLKMEVQPGEGAAVVSIVGPFLDGNRLTDALELEYCEGWPASRVGWGRLRETDLQQVMQVHGLYFDLTEKTFACAQVKGSNLAHHLIKTIDQAVKGTAVPGAVGPPSQKVLVLLGHDTNLVNVAGLLDLDWILPGSELDCVLPGGSLVFELRRDDAGRQWVRVEYVSETLQQLHDGAQIDGAHPPGVAPIFIPGCSTRSAGYDAPLELFERKLMAAIDERYVAD